MKLSKSKATTQRLIGSTWTNAKGDTWEVVELVRPGLYLCRTTDRTKVLEMYARNIRRAMTDAGNAATEKVSAAFTPGPWTATGGYCLQVKAGTVTVAGAINARADSIGGQQLSEITANAQLIAAAPDLLQACKELMEAINRCQTEGAFAWAIPIAHATAAIMKAEA